MNTPKLISFFRKFLVVFLVLALLLSIVIPAFATEEKAPYAEIEAEHRNADFTYELFLTDKNGMSITNPRKLAAGDTIFVEIRLTREGYKNPSYKSYGIEFRLMTRGLTFNYDGTTLRSGTDVREMRYSDGNSVGFAWYDMQQEGESINNPVLASSWSYTVDDPKMVNITVPVALIYITGEKEGYVPVGNATLYLDPDGGKMIGKDVSGTYPSGTKVILPNMEMGDWVFAGWTDGAKIYPAGTAYYVSGIVTLTPVWEELERNRHLLLDSKGGELLGEDISGYYADGQIVTLPDVQREGFAFLGWTDGVETYGAGDEYTVYNTVTISALWEAKTEEPAVPGETEGTGDDIGGNEGGSGKECLLCGKRAALVFGLCWLCLLILVVILSLIGIVAYLLYLLWKRSFFKYSLANGDLALDYRNGDRTVQVTAVLMDQGRKYPLAKRSDVQPQEHLQYIENAGQLPVAEVKPGRYEGKLIITYGRTQEIRKCRIEVTESELKENQQNVNPGESRDQ